MEVKPGYKQTEVGVIPEDWNIMPLSLLGDFSKGSGIRKDEAQSGDLPCVRYGEIYTHHNDIIREYNSRITLDVAKTAKRLRKGDILFAGSGETKEEIGKAVAFISDNEAYAGGDIVILRPRDSSSKFLGYVLNAPFIARQKACKGQGDAVVHISTSALASIEIPIPPISEQFAIAAALSDMDALLDGLDRLIKKKRAIKQAAMQQLLTGQTRLPGFRGEWEVLCFGDYVSIRNQKVLPIHVAPEILCVELEHIGQGDGHLLSRGVAGNSSATKYRFQTGDVLFGRLRSYLRKYWLATEDGICTTEIWPLMFDRDRVSPGFLFSLVQTDEFIEATNISYGTHMPRADWSVVCNLQIRLPHIEEQTAIAAVFSDMDAEITAVKTRRMKTHALKQTMMQELLTGRTRLVEAAEKPSEGTVVQTAR